MTGSERLGAVLGGATSSGFMLWGGTATDGVLSVGLFVLGSLAALGTAINVAK